jgi:hypothetical protein
MITRESVRFRRLHCSADWHEDRQPPVKHTSISTRNNAEFYNFQLQYRYRYPLCKSPRVRPSPRHYTQRPRPLSLPLLLTATPHSKNPPSRSSPSIICIRSINAASLLPYSSARSLIVIVSFLPSRREFGSLPDAFTWFREIVFEEFRTKRESAPLLVSLIARTLAGDKKMRFRV